MAANFVFRPPPQPQQRRPTVPIPDAATPVDTPPPRTLQPTAILKAWERRFAPWPQAAVKSPIPATTQADDPPRLTPVPQAVYRWWNQTIVIELAGAAAPQVEPGDQPPPRVPYPIEAVRQWFRPVPIVKQAITAPIPTVVPPPDNPPPVVVQPTSILTAWRRAFGPWPRGTITFPIPNVVIPPDQPPPLVRQPNAILKAWERVWGPWPTPAGDAPIPTPAAPVDNPPVLTRLPDAILTAWRRLWGAQRGRTAPIPTPVGIPTLLLTPDLLLFEAEIGEANPADQIVTVSNAGTGSLAQPSVGAITYYEGSDWLSLALPAGLILTASIDKTGLVAGVYHASVEVSSVGASNTPQTLMVVLRLTGDHTDNDPWTTGQPGAAAGPWAVRVA